MKEEWMFASREAAASALVSEVAERLRSAIAERGQAALVVSGGNSPRRFFELLSHQELDWSRVTVVASDERMVAEEHPDRNEKMIRECLFQNKAVNAQMVSLLPLGELPAHFDAVILGMGDDGHTASLFPDTPGIADILKSQQKTEQVFVPSKKMRRVTLTPRSLLASGFIALLFFGRDKAEVFEWACQNGKLESMPVRFVLQQHDVPMQAFWAT